MENKICDIGANAFAESLKTNQTCIEVDLSKNVDGSFVISPDILSKIEALTNRNIGLHAKPDEFKQLLAARQALQDKKEAQEKKEKVQSNPMPVQGSRPVPSTNVLITPSAKPAVKYSAKASDTPSSKP